MEEQKSASNRLLSDAIRSSVPSAIQAQCSAYPVAPWFDSKSDLAVSTDNISELDIALLNLKRKTFCHNAKARSSGEGSRTLLLTGCSSRRNAEYKYSYRGLLTNQAVSARVFERRYNAMLLLNKSHDHQKKGLSSITCVAKPLLNDDSFFSRMTLDIFVEAFSRHKEATKKSNKTKVSRSAPYAFKLNTKRHGKFQITANSNGTKSKRYVSTSKPELLISLPTIDVLAVIRKDEESLCGSVFDTVAVLGQQSLKCRGELIHLETKANELEAEQKSYLKQLAAVNRGRVNTPKDVPFVESLRNEADTQIDWSVPDDTNMKKRKAGDESATDGLNIDEQRPDDKKKKRKKDKKKKKRKKRKREKRKGKEDEDATSTAVQQGDEPKKHKVSKDVDENEVVSTTERQELVSREQQTIELPTMTPINLPPKRDDLLRKPERLSPSQGSQDCIDQQPNDKSPTSKLSELSPKQPELNSTAYSIASTEKSSPDSVAHMLNQETKPSSSLHNQQQIGQGANIDDGQQQHQKDDIYIILSLS